MRIKLNENLLQLVVSAEGVRVDDHLAECEFSFELVHALTLVHWLESPGAYEFVECEKDWPGLRSLQREREPALELSVVGFSLLGVDGHFAEFLSLSAL